MRKIFHGIGTVALAATVAAVAFMFVTSCSAQLSDRGGQEGAPVDKVDDVGWVVVYRNADGFPNIAQTCVAGLGFATTSTPRGESAGGAPLVRVEAWDALCATHAQPAPR